MEPHVCAVDVGTGSARAGIFDGAGRLKARADRPILMNRPRPDHAEHASEDIWAAVARAVREAREAAGLRAQDVVGLAFDATCSLVVRGRDGQPVSVSLSGERRWDTIVWLDHRAALDADTCTATGHDLIALCGGAMSPEMQAPKLMWLKRNLPGTWATAGLIFDLSDFLAWKATGQNRRSQGTLACKWPYLADCDEPWPHDLLRDIGLADLHERAGLPDRGLDVGSDLGPLSAEAAEALGLTTACRVGVGTVDAYAGALGVIGGLDAAEARRHAALIAGTSSCVMAMSERPQRFPGGWGPYRGPALPDRWIGEAGQSATGALLDHIVRLHATGGEPDAARHGHIARRVMELRAAEGDGFAAGLHVLPDFHGNRSPLADPHARGVISGLTLDHSFDALCRLYWRTCVGIALGVRHIVETLNAGGHAIDTLHVTGGHTRNPLLMELYTEATGCTIVEPVLDEGVLAGTAMIAATAAGLHADLATACRAMATPTRRHAESGKSPYERDYLVFLAMQRQRAELERLLAGGEHG